MLGKKKILFVITKGNWGGAQKYVYEVSTRLPQEKYDIRVAHGIGEELPSKLASASIKTFFLPKLGRDISFIKDVFSFFDLLTLFKKERPDIVHLNSSKIAGIGALAARLTGIPKIVFTVHGFAFNEERPLIEKSIIKILSFITVVLSTDVICISDMEYRKVRSWPFAKNKVHLIYNGISVPSFLSRQEARATLSTLLHTTHDFFDDHFIVGTIGELTTNKGYEYALRAFKNIPNTRYIVIGKGEHKQKLEHSIQEYHITQTVFLTDFITDAYRLLKAFDVFLLPSLKEGMPYVILEAAYAEVPVVSTHVGSIAEMITDQIDGILIPSKNSERISQAVILLQHNKSLREKYSQVLLKKVQNTFDIQKMIISTEHVYNL